MADLDSPTGIAFRAPYGYAGPGGAGARYGARLNPGASAGAQQVGAGLGTLARIVASAPSPSKMDAEESLAQDRAAQAQLRDVQMRQISEKLAANRAGARAQDAALPSAIEAKFNVPGQDTLDYLAHKIVAPQPETSDQPGIIGGYQTPAPEGMDPDKDRAIRNLVANFKLSGGLSGKTNLEQFQKGMGESNVNDAVTAAGNDPVKLALAALTGGATKGTMPFKEDSSGGTLNLYTGAQNQTSPLAVANIADKTQQAGAHKASADASYATAGERRAQTAKVQSETLPQVTLPNADGTPTQVLGKDVSKVVAAGAGGDGALTTEALDQAAARYRVDGTLPTNLGRGAQGSKNTALILNRAAQQAADAGQTGEAERLHQVATKATQKALANITNIGAGIDRSGAILDQHFGILEGLAKKMDPGTLQILNKAILAGRTQFNDPLANQYANQLQLVMLEYGRLKAGPNSSAMLPVEAIKLGGNALSAGLDVPSLEAIHHTVNQDITINRQQTAAEAARLSATMAPPRAPAPATAPVVAPAAPVTGGAPAQFASIAEAQAARQQGLIQNGSKIMVGGRPATWHD